MDAASAREAIDRLTDMPPAMGGGASGPIPGWLLRGILGMDERIPRGAPKSSLEIEVL